jgi:selenium metabolism protein YedF
MKTIDLHGLKCPMPLIKTKKVMLENKEEDEIKLLIDNEASFRNVKRYLEDNGFQTRSKANVDKYELYFSPKGMSELSEPEAYCEIEEDRIGNFVLMMARDQIGEGFPDLGHMLAQSLIKSISELNKMPKMIIFKNSGINLVTKGSEVIQELKGLESQGIEILVCGSCLEFTGKMKELEVGKVSNMLEIMETVIAADKMLNF